MMEVLFEYSSAEYRCIIYAQKSQLCQEIEHHLSLATIVESEVTVLSHTRKHQEEGTKKEKSSFYNDGMKTGNAMLMFIHWRKWFLVID